MLVVFYALENFINFFQKTGWSKTPLNLHMVSKGYIATKIPLKEGMQMKHRLKINVANESPKEGIVAYKKKKVRRGLLRKLFGTDADKVTIIIPRNSVNDVTICEVDERGAADAK